MWNNISKYYSPWIDVLTFSLMVGMIGYVFFSYSKLPVEIPIHFNLAGEADGWGHKGTLFGLIVLHIHAVLLCFVLNYFLVIRSDDSADSLQLLNIPFIKKEELTMEQIRMVKKTTAKMMAFTNLGLSLMFGVIYYHIIQTGLYNENGIGFGVEYVLILMLVMLIYYTWKIYRDVKAVHSGTDRE